MIKLLKIMVTHYHFGGEMGILSIDLDKINLMMLILMKMILKLLLMSDF